ncbi:hypothetical protein [Ensifer sp. B1-9]
MHRIDHGGLSEAVVGESTPKAFIYGRRNWLWKRHKPLLNIP